MPGNGWSHCAQEPVQCWISSIEGCPSGSKATPGRAASTARRNPAGEADIVSKNSPSASSAWTNWTSASASEHGSRRVPVSHGL